MRSWSCHSVSGVSVATAQHVGKKDEKGNAADDDDDDDGGGGDDDDKDGDDVLDWRFCSQAD